MSRNSNSLFTVFSAALLALVVLLGGAALANPAAAQDAANSTITVPGYGEAFGAPDVAYVTLGVETRNEDLATGMSDADSAMTAIIEAIRALEVDAADIQTVEFSVWSEESYGPEGPALDAPRLYRVTNIVRITVRDTELVQAVIDAGVTAGANRIHGVSFGLDDPAALEADARLMALADARDRAEQIAAAIGVTLGDVVSVTEGGSGMIPMMDRASYGMGGGGGIQEGQLSASIQVQVTFDVVR